MAAENGNGGVIGWIRQNLISLLAAFAGFLAFDKFTDMNTALNKATTDIATIAGTIRVHDDRIAGLRERVSRLEVNYMPWQRLPQRGSSLPPESPHEQSPDMPRNGLSPERRFN